MIDYSLAFKHYEISTLGVGRALRDVAQRIELEENVASEKLTRLSESMQCLKASEIVKSLLGVDLSFPTAEHAVITTQAIVQSIVKNDFKVDSIEDVLANAKDYAEKFITNPKHQYFFAKEVTAETATEVAVVEGLDVKVAVKADGKIKKGGREILAVALYEKFVKNAEVPLDNQGFIAVLMKELGMSKAGATTYNYNMKKKFGGTIVAKPKRAK